MTIAAISVASLLSARETARIARAAADIRALEADIGVYEYQYGRLPNSLDDLGRGVVLDPWGTPYRYLNFTDPGSMGAARKDRFLVPINSTYDLYSMGKDRRSVPPLTAPVSQDDIIRANDGAYIGLASQF